MMPSVLGLYTLLEMRGFVRRWLDTLRPGAVALDTGEESGTPYLDPLVTKEDIDFFINSSIAQRSAQLNLADETLLADEEFIDVEVDRVEYALPADMIALRELSWKDPSEAFTAEPPNKRQVMHLVDEQAGPNSDNYGVPTYRRRLHYIVLNEEQAVANAGGIKVDYVKWLLPLLGEDQYLETQFARLLQEVVILDAAIDLTAAKLKMDPGTLIALRGTREATLFAAVTASTMPKTIRLAPQSALVRPRSRRFR